MENISKNQLALIVTMLKLASNGFSNFGCNDVDEKVYKNWTLEERKEFVRDFHEWNGDPEEFEETFLHLADFAIMDFLAAKLEHEITN